jgi:hypothetical protein
VFRRKQHTAAWKFHVTEQNAGENKELLLKQQIQTEKHSVGSKTGISVADEKVLALLPEKHKNGLHVTREII